MKKLVTLLTALTLMFASAALAEAAFKTDEAGHPVFENFGEAKQYSNVGQIEPDCYIILVQEDNTVYRIVADYDAKAKALYEDYMKIVENRKPVADTFTAFEKYCSTLPARYDSEFTVNPVSQEELDKLAGKTLREAEKDAYSLIPYRYTEETDIISCALERGMYIYTVTLNESWEIYQKCEAESNFDSLTIKNVTWDGRFSTEAFHGESDKQ